MTHTPFSSADTNWDIPSPGTAGKESKRKSIGKMSEDLGVPSKKLNASIWAGMIYTNTYQYTVLVPMTNRKEAVNTSVEKAGLSLPNMSRFFWPVIPQKGATANERAWWQSKVFSSRRDVERNGAHKSQALCMTLPIIWAEQNVSISPISATLIIAHFQQHLLVFVRTKKRIRINKTRGRQTKLMPMCHFLTSATSAISVERHTCVYNAGASRLHNTG